MSIWRLRFEWFPLISFGWPRITLNWWALPGQKTNHVFTCWHVFIEWVRDYSDMEEELARDRRKVDAFFEGTRLEVGEEIDR